MSTRFVADVRVGDVYEKAYDGRVFLVIDIHEGFADVIDQDASRPRRISIYALRSRLRARAYTLLERGR